MRLAYPAAKQIDEMHKTAIAPQLIQNLKNKQYPILRPPQLLRP
jgi:hypothetical protein